MSQSQILLEVGTNELELVEFYIDEADGYRGFYGINVSKVVEISRSQPITAMPQMPHPSVLGAFPFRDGRIVPLIDISKFLNKGGVVSEDPRIIITEFNKTHTAFLVSGVTRIHRISWKQVEAPTPLLLEISGGSITAVVRLEGRVVFVLDAEAIVAAMNPALSVKMDENRMEALPDRKYHILHADDSVSIRRLVADLLKKEGRFDVTQANDGEEAWNLLLRYKQQAEDNNIPISNLVQGIITDIEMPNLDGLTLCRYIKEDHLLKDIPVAMFSSLISTSLAHKCKSVGADAQFAKPDLQGISDKMYELIQANQA
ncbi:MAG: chemotaxis protein [Desulfovibrio sp.]|jgi:two-component system chemotaxis response regulator CheV|nr:chemotaxis protein [Desulfovibrio sp.]